jgi:hypothetical protein
MVGHPPIEGRDERERCARKRSEAERVGCAIPAPHAIVALGWMLSKSCVTPRSSAPRRCRRGDRTQARRPRTIVKLEEPYHPKPVAGTREGPGIAEMDRTYAVTWAASGIGAATTGPAMTCRDPDGLGDAPYPTATLVADVIQKANQSVVLWRPLRRRHGDHAADRDPEQVLGSSFGGSGDLRLGISPA